MKTANITLEMNEGMTATINGSAYTGKNEVTLKKVTQKYRLKSAKHKEKKHIKEHIHYILQG